ncbi:MAG: serine/threonine-protein kinase [Candidatus Stygibacter australis]|nr:serine/threonine-protein kinase [Candidatus Stygibacter australis]
MPFCKKCGNKLESDAAFCPECGTPTSNTKSSQKKVEETTDDYKTQLRGKPQSYGVLNLENLPEGHIIDERYEIKEKVGQGGFGAVYRVYDKKMNIDKALKIIPEAIVSDEEAMADLQAEARTMISLNHNSIVRVYDFHDTGAVKYIDMEFVEGKTLTKVKLEHPNKQVPEVKVKELAIKIADGLAYAHSKGIIHKDIKPQNVMLNKDGEIKIMDFGIAETVRTSMSRIQNSSSSGTLVYMSPEQIKGKDVGKESDIYSFGAMLYELLCGHPPFYKGDVNFQILNEKPESLNNVSEEFKAIIDTCLEKDYRDRYSNFGEMFDLQSYEAKINLTDESDNLMQEKNRNYSSIMSYVTILFETQPKGASVMIDDDIIFDAPFKRKLSLGKHKVWVQCDGYFDVTEEIIVTEKSESFFVDLKSIYASISIKSKVKDFQVYLNEEEIKYFDSMITDLNPNFDYSFMIKHDACFYYLGNYRLSEAENKMIKFDPDEFGLLNITTGYWSLLFTSESGIKLPENNQIKLKPGKYKIEASIEDFPEITAVIFAKETNIIDYDDLIPKNKLSIAKGDFVIEGKLYHFERDEYLDLSTGEEYEIYPGNVEIRLDKKYFVENFKLEIIHNIDIDICKLVSDKRKKTLSGCLGTLIGLFFSIFSLFFGFEHITNSSTLGGLVFLIIGFVILFACISYIIDHLKNM